jgi:uncharacterized membrane protein
MIRSGATSKSAQEESFIMAEPTENPEQTRRRLERMGLNREQIQEVQRSMQAMAAQQMRNTIGLASNFLSTVVALLSSAVGFVAAFAWNDAIQKWLNAQSLFNSKDPTIKAFYYAIGATIFAIVVISILGFINGRLKGRSLISATTNTPY